MTDLPDTADTADTADNPGRHPLPTAVATHSRWFGLVWAVPLAALMVVAFLGVRALANRGIEVVVTFDNAAGARVHDTKVIYKGVEGGEVTKIDINEDGRRIDITLRLDRRSEPILNTETKFWLLGAKPDLSDISSVKAALAGLTIGVAPGVGGQPTRRFIGLSEPPLIMPGTPGTGYVLSSGRLGTAQSGSPVFYRGQEIGRVTAVGFTAPNAFRLDVFIYAPYDKLVRPQAAFWVSSPVQVVLTDKGVSANLAHAGALLKGAIELDLPEADLGPAAPPSPPGTQFPLYSNERDAHGGAHGPEVAYAFRFKGPAGELLEGAAVRLLGFEVGEVKSVRLEIDPQSGEAATAVTAVLYPRKLHVAGPAGATDDAAAWRGATDATVARLLARGHRARLVQSPPLIGGRAISLDAVPGAGAAVLAAAGAPGEPRAIPSDDAGGGLDEMTGQVNQILAKVNRIPFDVIGRQVQQLTGRLDGLVGSPALAESLQHLNHTMAQADRMMGEVAPQVGPLIAKLDSAAGEVNATAAAARGLMGGDPVAGGAPDANLPAAIAELTEAARSIRGLADYLGRHPESLVRGRGADRGADGSADRRKDTR